MAKNTLEQINDRLGRIEKQLQAIQQDEKAILADEDEEVDEFARLEALEEEIKKDVTKRPLARITYHDFTKGIIGAFFGIVGHFAFFYGSKIAKDITIGRAHALFITSLCLLVLFFYFSGFKKLDKNSSLYLPWRVLIIYVTAHAVIAFVLYLFGIIDTSMTMSEIYKNVASVSLLAIMGAATADLLGAEE